MSDGNESHTTWTSVPRQSSPVDLDKSDQRVALRFNDDKLPLHYWDLYPTCAKMIAWVQARGEDKYGYGNWMLGGKPDREYRDSAKRHQTEFNEGVDYDEDTGSFHPAQELWNLMNLIERNYSDIPLRDPDFDLDAYVEKWRDSPKNEIDPREIRKSQRGLS